MPLDVFATVREDESRPGWLEPLNDPRNEAILMAAYKVFVDKGLTGATMLEIATRAKVSKETLYDRFDSKEGLFYALLAWGARQTACKFDDVEARMEADPVKTLHECARDSLTAMLHPESLAVHRIAVGASFQLPEVGAVFAEFTCGMGGAIVGRIGALLNQRGLTEIEDLEGFVDTYIGLLRGKYHHEVVLRLRPVPDEAEIAARAHAAVTLLLRAYARPT